METIGKEVADNVKDMVLNIDLTKVQFDYNLLLQEADKLGINL